MPDRPPSARVPRRAVLGGGLGLGAVAVGALLSGCGVRIDDGATVPFLTRQRMIDEDLLLAAYRHEGALVQGTTVVTSPDPATVSLVRAAAARHTEQAAALRGILVAGGVPDHLIDPASATVSAPGPTPTSTPSPSAPITLAAVRDAALAAADPPAVAALDRAQSPHVLLLASCAAHAEVLAVELGVTPRAASSFPSAVAATLLPPTRAAAYAVELATARIPAAERTPALATVAWLRAREREWVAAAGALAPLPDLGFRLPTPVTSPAEAGQSIRAALAGLVAVGLSPLAATERPSGTAAATVSAHVETIRHAMTWGVPLTAFPGLARP